MSGFRILILTIFCGAVLAQDRTVYIAQVGHGGGFETTLSFVGLTNTTTGVLIETFDNDGDPAGLLDRPSVTSVFGHPGRGAASSYGIEVPAKGTREVQSMNNNEAMLQVGYAKITSDGPVGVEAVFRNFANGVRVTTTSVLPESPTMGFSILAYGQTGLALLNPPDNGGAAEVTVSLFDGAGRMLGETTVPLSAGSKAVAFLNQSPFFDSSLVPADFFGSVEISSTRPVVPVVIKIEGNALVTQTVQPAR